MALAAASHFRLNHGVLADAEKRLLVRIARRLPPSVGSDQLTLLALAAMAFAGAGFAMMRLSPGWAWLVVGALAVNWFGDSLDGTVARVRGHERPRYGYYVDHVLDLAGTTMLFTGLALSPVMSPLFALTVLVAYLLVSAEVFLATAAHGTFRMSFLGFGPTELRVVLAVGALSAAATPWVSPFGFGPVRLFDLGGAIAAVGMMAAFVTSTLKTALALYRAEPLPGRQRRRDVTTF